MNDRVAEEDAGGKILRHVWRIQLCKPEGGLAELAVFLLRVGQPFHQAVLVDVLDTAATFARVEERLRITSLHSAYPAGVWIPRSILAGG